MEPIIPIIRFEQAVNRLEVMRGIEDASTKLFSRMARKYKVWNLRDERYNYRLTDLGMQG